MAIGQGTGREAIVAFDPLTIRPLHHPEEFQACVALQKVIWNFADLDIVPMRMFIVADKIGGQVIGCFDGNELVGFAIAIPGTRSGKPYLHSHMLGVKDSHRNAGVGRRIKLAQRADALERGFELIEWTFDPLEIKNAYLNIEKLGAIARRYNVNQYGKSSSPLQGGLPTDRLVAEWWLKSKRVLHLLSGESRQDFEVGATITVPAEIYDWKANEKDRGKAREVHSNNRQRFLEAFDNGASVLGFERDAAGHGTYLLGIWDEDWSYASASQPQETTSNIKGQ